MGLVRWKSAHCWGYRHLYEWTHAEVWNAAVAGKYILRSSLFSLDYIFQGFKGKGFVLIRVVRQASTFFFCFCLSVVKCWPLLFTQPLNITCSELVKRKSKIRSVDEENGCLLPHLCDLRNNTETWHMSVCVWHEVPRNVSMSWRERYSICSERYERTCFSHYASVV